MPELNATSAATAAMIRSACDVTLPKLLHAAHTGEAPMSDVATMTLEQLQKRLREAHARIGFEGRFAFTIDQSAALNAGKGHGGCYVTHWFRPTPYAFEDCKAVGSGSVADCIVALDLYVETYRAEWQAVRIEEFV
jgi:hypothetical protein